MKFKPDISGLSCKKTSFDELRELCEKSKIIFDIEDWVLLMHEEMTSESWHKNILVGRNFYNRKEIMIKGKVKDAKEKAAIIDFFNKKNPPVEPFYSFELAPKSGLKSLIKLSKIKKKERRKIKIDIEPRKK